LEETTTHTIGQNVLDMSATQDKTATLQALAAGSISFPDLRSPSSAVGNESSERWSRGTKLWKRDCGEIVALMEAGGVAFFPKTFRGTERLLAI